MGISLVCLDMHGEFHKLRRVARHSNEERQIAKTGYRIVPNSWPSIAVQRECPSLPKSLCLWNSLHVRVPSTFD